MAKISARGEVKLCSIHSRKSGVRLYVLAGKALVGRSEEADAKVRLLEVKSGGGFTLLKTVPLYKFIDWIKAPERRLVFELRDEDPIFGHVRSSFSLGPAAKSL